MHHYATLVVSRTSGATARVCALPDDIVHTNAFAASLEAKLLATRRACDDAQSTLAAAAQRACAIAAERATAVAALQV